MKISTTLKRAQSLIASPENWIIDFLAVDANDSICGPESSHAKAFCLRGAVKRAARHSGEGHVEGFLAELLSPEKPFDFGALGAWNNEATHDEVLMALDFAILAAKDEGQ